MANEKWKIVWVFVPLWAVVALAAVGIIIDRLFFNPHPDAIEMFMVAMVGVAGCAALVLLLFLGSLLRASLR